jgi:hypothetical protein
MIVTLDDIFIPDPIYTYRPLEWFVGRSVKIAFQSHGGGVEYMWVKEIEIDGPNLTGKLENHPVLCTHVRLGDQITLSRVHIVAVDLTEDEWWDEVFMLRARGDFFNRHLGTPSLDNEFKTLFQKMTPRQALERWVKWSPIDD